MNNAECFPDKFDVRFVAFADDTVETFCNGAKIGDVLTDNNYKSDYYRYHDVFHFTFATLLNWSPCIRSLLFCKRKSLNLVDEVEDGARAKSIEEGICAIVFSDAEVNNWYKNGNQIDNAMIKLITQSTKHLEVSSRTADQWKEAIQVATASFLFLRDNGGGNIMFDRIHKSIIHQAI